MVKETNVNVTNAIKPRCGLWATYAQQKAGINKLFSCLVLIIEARHESYLEGDPRHEEQLGDETDDICHENKLGGHTCHEN